MSASSNSIGSRHTRTDHTGEASSFGRRRARSPTKIPSLQNDLDLSSPSGTFSPSDPHSTQSTKISSAARDVFHPERNSEGSTSSPSSSSPTTNINGLIYEGEHILDLHRSKASSSTSPPPSRPLSFLTAEERALEMIDRLKEMKYERIITKEGTDELEKISNLVKRLRNWLESQRAAKLHLIQLLCEAIPPSDHSPFGLDKLQLIFDSIPSSTSSKKKFTYQSEILEKFDRFFHNEATFKKLALYCAHSATTDPNSPFRYRTLTGGLGYVLSLNLVEKSPTNEEQFHPLFVCKPIEAQPGGRKFSPYSDPVSEQMIDEYLQESKDTRIEQLNNTARSGLSRIFGEDLSLSQLMKIASQQGLIPDDTKNLTVDQMMGILYRLGGLSEFVDQGQAERVLKCIKGLFNAEDIVPGHNIDLLNEEMSTNPVYRRVIKKKIEEEREQLREREIESSLVMTAPFRGAKGVEVNHVVISNSALGKKYPSIFEKPLQSTLIERFPFVLKTGTEEIIEREESAMVMEYCPHLGTLESTCKDKDLTQIDEKQFYPEQLETRFILGALFGFADQNMGNELIVDQQIVLTSEGPQKMIRLASIDMGQANATEPLNDSNPPFYITYDYLRTGQFYERILEKTQKVDFNQLLNEIIVLYEGNRLPLSEQQIKLMIFRWESLKKLAESFKKEFDSRKMIPLDDLKDEFHRIVQGKAPGGIDSYFTEMKKSSKSPFKKRSKTVDYKVGKVIYRYRAAS